ncbi:MAG: BamA/TamA family outer membrane protein [candidate division WOR-3 bacterium]|nr:BamA/TamA family outer membrane protein [candidate division WOR-3 bacterium]
MFIVHESTCVYIRQIKIRGNREVSEEILLTTIGLKPREKFSLKRLTDARQMLYATQLFERVQFYLLNTEFHDSIDVRFDVIELPSRSVGLGLGFQIPPAGLIVSANWRHFNFLKKRHNFEIGVNFTPFLNENFKNDVYSDYRIFNVFGIPVELRFISKWTLEKDDSIRNNILKVESAINKNIGKTMQIGTALKYIQLWSNYPAGVNTQYQSITNSQTIYMQFDSRNHIFNPSYGMVLNTKAECAGGIFKGNNDFYKIQSEVLVFYPITFTLVIASRVTSGILFPYGRNIDVPYYNLFLLGGNNGLRGYPEKYRYGDALLNVNFEIRSNLKKIFDFVIFCDFGKINKRKDFFNFSYNLLNYSAGAGMRINFPFGPLRFDYAKRLHSIPDNDWGKIHIGFLNFF